MDVRGSHGRTPVPGHDAIELRPRGGPSTSAAGAVSHTDAARNEQIQRIANTLLSACRGGGDISDIMHQKAVILHDEMHQTDDMVKDVIKRATKFDDTTSQLAGGTVGLTYGLANIPGDLIGKATAKALGLQEGTPAHDFVSATAAGMTAVAFKAVLTRVIGNSLQESKWMQADMDALEPSMQKVMEERDTFGHRMKQSTLGGSGYNIRNPITGGISSGIQLADESAPNPNAKGITAGMGTGAYLGNQFTGTLLTSAAGAVSGHFQNKHDNLHGAEFLFGRHDWQQRYMALSSGRTHSGEGSRLHAMWQHATTPKKWAEGVTVLSVLSAMGIETAEAFGLGVPLGLAKMGKGATSRAHIAGLVEQGKTALDVLKSPANRASAEALSQLPNLPLQAVAYFLQGAAGNAATEIAHRVDNWLHPHTESAASEGERAGSERAASESAASEGERAGSERATSERAASEGERAGSERAASEREASEGERAGSERATSERAASEGERAGSERAASERAASEGERAPSERAASERAASEGERAGSERAASAEASDSDNASLRSHYSGSLRNTPPPRSQAMRVEGDTHPWWTDFIDVKRTDPKPATITPEEAAAINEYIDKKAEELIRQIASIPLPSGPGSSAASLTSRTAEPVSATEIPLPSGPGSSAASLTSRAAEPVSATEIPLPSGPGSSAASLTSRAAEPVSATEIPLPSGPGSSAASLTSRASRASEPASAPEIPLPASGGGSSGASTTSAAKK